MIISPSRNFIFIHLEKCGGTSVESALQPYLHWSDMILGSTEFGEKAQQNYYERFGREEVNKFMLWKHSTAKDIYSFIQDGWDDFIKFSIVRNPVELVVSLYKFSQMTIKYHFGRINKEYWRESIRIQEFPNYYPFTEGYIHGYIQSVVDGSGINGFVDYIINNDYDFIKPQIERLEVNKNIGIDLIFDLSDIHNIWDQLTKQIGIEEKVTLQRLNVSEPAETDLSNRSIKKIKKHFAIDYDLLPRYTGISW
jgi:hypothetical protein